MKKIMFSLMALIICISMLTSGCARKIGGGKHEGITPTADTDETEALVTDNEDESEEETEEKEEPNSAEAPVEKETEETQPEEEPEVVPTREQESGTKVLGTSSKGYTIEMRDGIVYIGDTIIANKSYSLPSNYNPGGLTPACSSAFSEMKAAAAEEGMTLEIVSGFRSYELQDSLYNRYCASDGKDAADTYSARPGHSEHQTGLAMDLNSLYSSFGDTAEGKWLAKNSWKYGFILRYPADKVAITGYIYEPWHFRYVGKDLAKDIYESGLCLEEYFGITSSYS